ncbi:MAG: nucleotide sugar dehydrogenase [Nitrososphaerota archaeon]
MMIRHVSVIGLGKLGLCIAAVLAHRGFKVKGVDVDEEKVKAVNGGETPIQEPGLDRLIWRNRSRLEATVDHREAVQETQATFIVVPTPSEPDGSFSLKYVKEAVSEIGKVLSSKRSYHLVVLNSTVMPGSLDNHVKPMLEEHSGKKCGLDFGLCYNPEFIALGDVIQGLLRPDLVLIGESDRRAGDLLAKMYRRICTNNPPIERTSFINAEIAKIAINSFITMKITFANTLAEICERTCGANVDDVTRIIGRDSRIGPKYLKGGLGYGGPCFPRDNIAFARFAESVGAQAELAMTTHKVNLRQPERIIRIIEEIGIPRGAKIGVLGLSYKPKTPVVEESQAIYLIRRLQEMNYEVHVYDPIAIDAAKAVLYDSVTYENSLDDLMRNCDVLVIATPWSEFKTIRAYGKIILDCWRIVDRSGLQGCTYIPLGASLKS